MVNNSGAPVPGTNKKKTTKVFFLFIISLVVGESPICADT